MILKWSWWLALIGCHSISEPGLLLYNALGPTSVAFQVGIAQGPRQLNQKPEAQQYSELVNHSWWDFVVEFAGNSHQLKSTVQKARATWGSSTGGYNSIVLGILSHSLPAEHRNFHHENQAPVVFPQSSPWRWCASGVVRGCSLRELLCLARAQGKLILVMFERWPDYSHWKSDISRTAMMEIRHSGSLLLPSWSRDLEWFFFFNHVKSLPPDGNHGYHGFWWAFILGERISRPSW